MDPNLDVDLAEIKSLLMEILTALNRICPPDPQGSEGAPGQEGSVPGGALLEAG